MRQSFGAAIKESAQLVPGKRFRLGASLTDRECGPLARGGAFFLYSCIEDRIDAVRKALQRPTGETTRTLVTFKRGVDATQYRVQRNARFLPGLDDGPIKRGHQQMCAAFLPEVLLDFRKIIDVIERIHGMCRPFRCRSASRESYPSIWRAFETRALHRLPGISAVGRVAPWGLVAPTPVACLD